MAARKLTYECREATEAWMRAWCPCAFDDPEREFYKGVLAIVEMEVERALKEERSRVIRDVTRPSEQ